MQWVACPNEQKSERNIYIKNREGEKWYTPADMLQWDIESCLSVSTDRMLCREEEINSEIE